MQSEAATGNSNGHTNGFRPDRRLHRLSWIFVSAKFIQQMIFPLVALVFFGAKGSEYQLWLVPIALVGIVIAALWHQWVYRYGFGPDGLVIKKGLIFRNVRNLDYERIENVDTERNLLHRLFGVAEVRVETSSGGSSEAVIRVLDLDGVEEMRNRIFRKQARSEQQAAAGSATGESDAAGEETLLHLGSGELVRYGLIDNRGMIVVAALLGIASQVGMEQLIERYVEPVIARLPIDSFIGLSTAVQVFMIVSAVLGLIAGTRVLSILLALITLHDFTLTKEGEDLRARHGLFTRISLTMRRPRIQAVHQRESLLHRLFKRVALRVDLAGGLGSNANQQQGQGGNMRKLWLAPVTTREKAAELVRVALPMVKPGQLDWQKLSPKARFRLGRLLSVVWLICAGPVSVWQLGWWSLAVLLPMLPVCWGYAHLYVKYTGWALHDEFFVLRRGWLNRKVSYAPRNRVQSVRVSESPFDRRYHMASIAIDTAGATGLSLRIPFLDRKDADYLAGELYGERTTVDRAQAVEDLSESHEKVKHGN